jgi:membrane protein involved in colicin uptake
VKKEAEEAAAATQLAELARVQAEQEAAAKAVKDAEEARVKKEAEEAAAAAQQAEIARVRAEQEAAEARASNIFDNLAGADAPIEGKEMIVNITPFGLPSQKYFLSTLEFKVLC